MNHAVATTQPTLSQPAAGEDRSPHEGYLPVIDIGPSFLSAEGERRVAMQIDKVCREKGFFYIVGHKVPQDVIARAFAFSERFFALSKEQKELSSTKLSPIKRGWDPIGILTLDSGKPVDLLEGFTIGHDLDPTDPLGDKQPRRGPNPYPSEELVPGMRQDAERYLAELAKTAKHLLRLIAIGLKLPADFFEEHTTRIVSTMRILHYPPHPAQALEGQAGAGAHTDWGALTLLAQDDCGGLQVRDGAGAWHDVPPVSGSFVVNLGDLMARWTNDAYRSTMHRVYNNVSGRDRYSIPYFFDINYFARVKALPGCFDAANPPKYREVTAGEHHLEKQRAARGDLRSPAAAT